MKKCIDCGRKITNRAKRCIRCFAKLRRIEKNKCIDCGKEVSARHVKRCASCYGKSRRIKKPNCIDCGKKLTHTSTQRCKSCYAKYCVGKNNPNWRDGRHKCPDCGKELFYRKFGRCKSCSSKYYIIHHNAKWKERSKCIDCRKELKYGKVKRCRSCARKYLWKEKSFQKKQAISRQLKPNKPEKYLIKLLHKKFPNEYKYIGDLQFWLGGKNPDFMNVNGQKKLIELYGSYWHKDDNPRNRINHFKKYGFDTLVIWEKELNDVSRLEKKLYEFIIK